MIVSDKPVIQTFNHNGIQYAAIAFEKSFLAYKKEQDDAFGNILKTEWNKALKEYGTSPEEFEY